MQKAKVPSPEAVEEFKTIYYQEFGIRLNNAEAIEKASRLLNFFKTIYRPPKN